MPLALRSLSQLSKQHKGTAIRLPKIIKARIRVLMARRTIFITIVLLIICLVCYLFFFNKAPITVNFAKDSSVTAPAALVFIITFCLGALFTWIFSLIFALKATWREKKLVGSAKKQQAAFQRMIKAREFLASEQWDKAKEEWNTIVKRSPNDTVARVELSRSLQGDGNIKEAIKILDTARAADPENVEVLFRAAELNLALGNKTAAVDNLALILYHNPSQKAARLARDLSASIGRIDDALEYQSVLERMGGKSENDDEIIAKLNLEKIEKELSENPEQKKKELQKLVKGKTAYVPALKTLAQIELKAGNTEEAVSLLLRAAKQSQDHNYWEEAAIIWLDQNNPDKAIATARSGNSSMKDQARATSELELVKLYLSVNMIAEARKTLDNFKTTYGSSINEKTARIYKILQGRCYNVEGKLQESARKWQELSESDFSVKEVKEIESIQREQPSPVLSTP